MTKTIDVSMKVTAEHLVRSAFVYVRQSSARQVEYNLESQRRQYNMRQQANDLGWPDDKVVVIDDDQGKTGTIARTRAGFEQLATAVGRSEVGIVLSLEVSRLARNSPDWHHLIYLCRWTGTLMADEHTIYDPSHSSDRLLLGIRGQFAEMETDTSIHRMIEARWNKARRGEYLIVPPAGYEIDDSEQQVMTSDELVQEAIRTTFAKFDELGTARQVFIWFRDHDRQFPVRATRRRHPVVWVSPLYRHFLDVLRHPTYAGVYAFGQTKTVRGIDPADPTTVKVTRQRVDLEDWPVLIRDHHAAYISFEKFLENRERIRSNCVMTIRDDQAAKGPAREGKALLQGLVRCGHCGRRMTVSYGGRRSSPTTQRTVQYRCYARRNHYGDKDCQIVGGKQIDNVVVQAFLDAIAPAGVDAAVLADEQLRRETEAIERHWELRIESAKYQVDRAQRQYDAVEPENRIVARELERRWNEQLQQLEAVRSQARAAKQKLRPLTELELARAKQLGADLEVVWNKDTTTNRDRKQLLRYAIEEVQLRGEDKTYHVRIVWKGGLVTDHEVVRFRRGQWNVTPEDTVELMRKLAREFDDAQIARILNKQGRRSGPGNAFTKAVVAKLRRQHGIAHVEKRPAQDPREGPFTADEAARELGVSETTIHRWLRDGVLAGSQATPGAPWRIVLGDETRRRLCDGDAPTDWVGLTEAARRLGLAKSNREAHGVENRCIFRRLWSSG
jgi:DNA invertase Pin-like site-specific DNA recombinase